MADSRVDELDASFAGDCYRDAEHYQKMLSLARTLERELAEARRQFDATHEGLKRACEAATATVARLLIVHENRTPNEAATIAQQMVVAAYSDSSQGDSK